VGARPLLSQQVDQYRTDGYVVLGKVLDDAEIAAMLGEEARFRPQQGLGARDNRTLLVSVQLCDRSAVVRRVCTRGAHLAHVVELLGPNVCLTHNQFLTKLPDDAGTRSDIPLHQDNGYGRLEPPEDITVWFALTDTTVSNGCLEVMPGSHERGLAPHEAAAINPALREASGEGSLIAVELAAGEAIAFTGLTLHRSGPNLTEVPRTAFYARYCAPHVRMMSEGGRSVLTDPHSWMVAGESQIDSS
jgi:ectoine hydroxylase-related dioxygenase (phytanoyl-CoA dioxygenase family)